MTPRAVILGCSGPHLTPAERAFFEAADPFGFILFRRNVGDPDQVRDLAASLRDAVGRPDAPILIDQEGGRVARLQPPHWPALPPARTIGRLAERDPKAGETAARALGRVIGAMLADLGLSVACAPVADLLLPETHDVIGDRAFSSDPACVARLASAVSAGLRDAGVLPIIKHIPGHGRATADSHLTLPRIDADHATLKATDFRAFADADPVPWAMVAHCVYESVDPTQPASISRTVIEQVVRGEIGFSGVLIADDIGMKALDGTLAENAAATLAAGCDLTLHCSGVLDEMESLIAAVPALSPGAVARIAQGKAWLAEESVAFDPDGSLIILRSIERA